MSNSQRFSEIENKLRLLEQKLESFQAPAIRNDFSELEDRVRKAEQRVAFLTDANKIAAVEDRKTFARMDLVETTLEEINTTLTPLQELLNDNQAVEPREERLPDAGHGPSIASFTKGTALPGLNLEGASLDDLKKLRKFVNKRIKAVSRQKAEPETGAIETTINYQKPQDEASPEGRPERLPTERASRAGNCSSTCF